jgi:hypothetical protein
MTDDDDTMLAIETIIADWDNGEEIPSSVALTKIRDLLGMTIPVAQPTSPSDDASSSDVAEEVARVRSMFQDVRTAWDDDTGELQEGWFGSMLGLLGDAITRLERATAESDERHLFNPSCPCETCSQTRTELFDKHIGRSHITAPTPDVARALELLRTIDNRTVYYEAVREAIAVLEHAAPAGTEYPGDDAILLAEKGLQVLHDMATEGSKNPEDHSLKRDDSKHYNALLRHILGDDTVDLSTPEDAGRLAHEQVNRWLCGPSAPALPEGWRWEGNSIASSLGVRLTRLRGDRLEIRVRGNEWCGVPVAVLRELVGDPK